MIRKITKRVPVSVKKHKVAWLIAALFFLICALIPTILFTRLYFSSKKVIETHLNSQKWSLPSTIYADAPMLYEGMPMKFNQLVEYLKRLNYQEAARVEEIDTGQYLTGKQTVSFYKHLVYPGQSGDFPAGVTFGKSSIEKIANLKNGEELPAYELEPAPISNLFGSEWEKRTIVRYQDLPKHLISAVVAIEDRRFFTHGGVDLKAIVRAVVNDLLRRKQLQGGSTITQQLVKNFYLTPERSLKRKLSEAMMAWLLEGKQTKQQILEMYLNEIYLGQRGAMSINGVGEASRVLFHKDVRRLTVPEAALLAGMIQAPNIYNPYRHAKEAKARR